MRFLAVFIYFLNNLVLAVGILANLFGIGLFGLSGQEDNSMAFGLVGWANAAEAKAARMRPNA